MKRLCGLFAVTMIIIFAMQALAKEPSIGWSGFFDVQYNAHTDTSQDDGFSWGQFELDVEGVLSRMVSYEGAVAYNGVTFELGTGLLDIHPQEGLGLIIGQFDVPLGRDFNHYPAPDRALISAPLLNTRTYDGWNDLGLQGYARLGAADVSVYLVNGMNPTRDNQAIGARVTVGLDNGEFGISYALDDTLSNQYVGIDGMYKIGGMELTAEVLQLTNSHYNQSTAYYLQCVLPVGNFFGVVRYGSVVDNNDWNEDSYDSLSRLSLGAGWQLDEITSLRTEYQINRESRPGSEVENNILTLQAVTEF